jgi:hypothetical protein
MDQPALFSGRREVGLREYVSTKLEAPQTPQASLRKPITDVELVKKKQTTNDFSLMA